MEHSTVSLKTAQALKGAGFPQHALFWWMTLNDGEDYSLAYGVNMGIAAPTAQEIADELPPTTVVYIYKEKLRNGYSARYRLDPALNWTMVAGDNLAEALAALYLKLKEAK